jgi:hypothetical protein
MRLPAGLVVVVLALYGGQTVAASPAKPPPPQYTQEEAHAGCLQTELRLCMISLGAALMFDMNRVAEAIAKRNETDVNGKPVRRTIDIAASAPGHHELVGIVLTLASPAPNDTVVKAELLLPADPDFAHTQAEYDKTYLYDVLVPLLGKRCPGLDRMTLYRFFENTLKPRETRKVDAQKPGVASHIVATTEAANVPFCGARFSLHKRAEWNGLPDRPDVRSFVQIVRLDVE